MQHKPTASPQFNAYICECSHSPLCRHHHRCKQAEGWQLTQPEPGVLVWHTPAGRTYTTIPTPVLPVRAQILVLPSRWREASSWRGQRSARRSAG
jgi:hypothetical protein